MTGFCSAHVARYVILFLGLGWSVVAAAQDVAPPSSPPAGQTAVGGRDGVSGRPTGEPAPLPPDATTRHTLTLPDRTLSFSATAGSIRHLNARGEPQADIAFTAYQLDDADPRVRPVTFVFNGGPGASSAWLQFGNAGPWRIDMNKAAGASAELLPNADTWLDFTDLVFIDPVGTGYSRFVVSGDAARDHAFVSVNGDAASVATTIRRWLERFGRQASPKFVVGQSYGGIRAPRVVQGLGAGVKGLILVSPLLDYRDHGGSSILQYVARLPTMAAIAREQKGAITHADMADVERYARTDFLLDLIKGEADSEATIRLADRVAALTGLDEAVSRRVGGRFSRYEFRRTFGSRHGRSVGDYDASASGVDIDPLVGPLTNAAVAFYAHELNWQPNGPYNLLSREIFAAWRYGTGATPVGSVGYLREILASDPPVKLLVAHGLFDLATPYFGSRIALDQLAAAAMADRVKLVVYPGGHMFYSRDASRLAFRAEVQALMK